MAAKTEEVEESTKDDGKGAKGGKRNYAVKIKDQEGVDFGYYFSQKYAMIHENKRRRDE